MKNLKKKNGFTMVFALILAMVMGLSVVSIAKLIQFNSRQSVHFTSTNQAFRLAEMGLNAAIAQLAKDPDPALATTGLVYITNPAGTYQNTVSTRSVPFDPIHYVISEGKFKAGSHTYSTRLHSYVRVSNVGDYFAAIKDEITLTPGLDLSGGRVYAPKLNFLVDYSGITKVLTAEYVDSITPAINTQGTDDPSDDAWSNPANAPYIKIMNPDAPPGSVPRKLPGTLLFPEVFSSDLEDWKIKAGSHTVVCNFGQDPLNQDIYPPGYSGYTGANFSNDTYPYGVTGAPLHEAVNARHIYYCPGDMHIQGNIHGQILFVSTGNIYITDNLTVSTAPDARWQPSTYSSGAGASLANEAILITQGTVYISPLNPAPIVARTEKIQALIMAPNASLMVLPYGDPSVYPLLSLDYKGTMILSEIASVPPNNLPTVFQASRQYSYDRDFKDFPPPYLPAIAQIYYMLEENEGSGSLFGI